MKRSTFPKIASTILLLVAMLLPHVSPARAAAPLNNDFDTPTVVPSIPFSDAINTFEADQANDDPDCFGNGPTVWYVFTPSEDLRVGANTFGSDYDTTLSVYIGERSALTQIACNDDTLGLQSRVVFDAFAGETYYFMVGAFGSGPGGNLSFNVNFAPPPLEIDLVIHPTASVKASTGVVTLSGTVTCSQPSTVDIYGTVEQRAGRVLLRGYIYSFLECDGETPWSAQVIADNGIFKAGKANVALFAYGFSTDEGDWGFAESTQELRLRGSGR